MTSQKSKLCFVLLFAVSGLFMPGGTAQAIDFTWTGAGTTDWDDPVSWVGGAGIPDGNNDTATINIAGPDPELVSSRIVGALTLSNNGDLNMNNFSLTVQNNTGQSGLTLVTDANSDLNVETGFLDTDDLTIQSGGEVDIRGGTVEVDFDPVIGDTGLLNGFGTFRTSTANSTSLENDGTITAAGGTLQITRTGTSTSTFDWDGTGTNQAELNVSSGATLDIDMPLGDTAFNGTITLDGTSTLDTAGFTYSLPTGGITDSGILNKNSAGTGRVIASSFTLSGGGSEVNVNAGTLVFDTDLTANSGSATTWASGTTIEFNGTTNFNDGAVINNNVPYNMTIRDDATITSTGDFNLDGNGAGSNTITVQNNGSSLTLDVDNIDLGDDLFNATINLDGGDLDVNNTANIWTMAGTMNFTNGGFGSDVSGARVIVTGDINVAANTNGGISPTVLFEGTANVSIAAGGELALANTTTFRGGNYTGTGELEPGSHVFEADTTIDVGIFDWDGIFGGNTSTVNDGINVVINSAEINSDFATNDFFTGTAALDGGDITINTPGPWRLGSGSSGTVLFSQPAGNAPDLNGSKMVVENGVVRVLSGTARINAEVEYQTAATVDVLGTALNHNGFTTYNGGTYTGTTINQNADAQVVSDTTISVNTFNWDGGGSADMLIASGATLNLNVNAIDIGDGYGGEVTIEDGATLNVNTPGAWSLDGSIILGAAPSISPLAIVGGADLKVESTARVDGNGQIAVNVISDGNIAPGLSAGFIRVRGMYEQTKIGTYEVGIGGLDAISQHDQIDVVALATLNGELAITLEGGYAPDAGDVFKIMTYGSRVGDFATLGGDVVFGPGPSEFFVGVPMAMAYFLYVPLAADGNLDGSVDGLDYLLWAANFGDNPADDPPGAPQNGDYNGDGMVDGLDYLLWAGNFGEMAFPNDAVAVPEPSALALALCGLISVWPGYRRRQSL